MSDELLELARTNPKRALALTAELLVGSSDDPKRLSSIYRARGQAAMALVDYPLAAASYEASIIAANEANDPATTNRVAISLAGAYFDLGDPERAYATLDEVDRTAQGENLGISLGQRAGLLVDQGRLDEAISYFQQSMPHLEGGTDRFHLANSHLNMGSLYLETSELESATDSYHAALSIYRELDMPLKCSGALHNLARVAGRQGDLIGSLEAFEESERQYMSLAGKRSHHGADKCEVLIQAGLLDEAVQETDELKSYATKSDDPRQLGNAHYLASMAHALANRPDLAIDEARSASLIFADNTSTLLSGLATLVELDLLDPDEKHATVALELASKFARRGHRSGEVRALAISAYHHPVHRQADVDILARGTSDPRSAIRQASRLGLARIHLAVEEPLRAMSLLEESLADISEQVGLQSSASVRQSMATHLQEVQLLGISILHARGHGESIERWIDASRLVSSTQPPLRPAADPELATMVSQLRLLQSTQATGHDREISRLESEIGQKVQRSRSATLGNSRPTPSKPTSRLKAGATIIRLYASEGVLSRVASGSTLGDVAELGPVSEIQAAMRFIGADLRQLASSPSDSDLCDRLAADAARLRSRLIPSGGSDLVICPPPNLLSFPWSILAETGQAITVTPSMHYWNQANQSSESTRQGLTAIAGPGLSHASHEVEAISDIRTATLAMHDDATVETAIGAFAGSGTVHLACHGNHHRSNPRFSSIRLADGNLFAHDIEQMASTPETVIMTACDSGIERAIAGEEAIGFGTALLGRGTRTVIAGTSLVPDTDLLIRFASHLHRELDSGTKPARALVGARQLASDTRAHYYQLSAFTCLGWG